MALQPNPCLDPCQFEYDTATGKSQLRLDPAGGIGCGPAGLGMAAAVSYTQHSYVDVGVLSLSGGIATGVTNPLSFAAWPVTAIPGLPDFVTAHDAHVMIEASFDAMIISAGLTGEGSIDISASVDGGVSFQTVQRCIHKCLTDGGQVGYTTEKIAGVWNVPLGYNIQPRFLLEHTLHVGGVGTTAYLRVTRIEGTVFYHRRSSGAALP